MDYRNVKKSAPDLSEMMKHTGGEREVPVILEGDTVTIGYGGT